MIAPDLRSLDVSYMSCQYDEDTLNYSMVKLIDKWLQEKRVEYNNRRIFGCSKDANYKIISVISHYTKELKMSKEDLKNNYNYSCAHFSSDTWNLINPVTYYNTFCKELDLVKDRELDKELLQTTYFGTDWDLKDLKIDIKDVELAFSKLGTIKKVISNDCVIIRVDDALKTKLQYIPEKTDSDHVVYNPARHYFEKYPILYLSSVYEYYPYLVIRFTNYIDTYRIEKVCKLGIIVPKNSSESVSKWLLQVCTKLAEDVADNGLCYDNWSHDKVDKLKSSDKVDDIIEYYSKS